MRVATSRRSSGREGASRRARKGRVREQHARADRPSLPHLVRPSFRLSETDAAPRWRCAYVLTCPGGDLKLVVGADLDVRACPGAPACRSAADCAACSAVEDQIVWWGVSRDVQHEAGRVAGEPSDVAGVIVLESLDLDRGAGSPAPDRGNSRRRWRCRISHRTPIGAPESGRR